MQANVHFFADIRVISDIIFLIWTPKVVLLCETQKEGNFCFSGCKVRLSMDAEK